MKNSTINSSQKYKLQGIKFFKGALDNIAVLRNTKSYSNPITTSEIIIYMIAHKLCDDMGRIHAFTTEKDVSERKKFSYVHIADTYGIKYETVKSAFDKLEKRSLLKINICDNEIYYEITNYAYWNNGYDNNEKLNYFIVPTALFESDIFPKLITHRFHNGAYELLKLCEHFTRQIGLNHKNTEDLSRVTATRNLSYYKKALGTNKSQRVRQFLDIINHVFISEKVGLVEKIDKVHSITQLWIHQFKITMNKSCYVENILNENVALHKKAIKDMEFQIKHNPKLSFINWRDQRDINASISRMINIAKYLGDDRELMIKHVLQYVYAAFDEFDKFEIKSIGAYFNTLFSNAWKEFAKIYLNNSKRVGIMHRYHLANSEYPKFLLNI